MNVVVLYNPVSGSGSARRLGRCVTERLAEAGHDISRVPTKPSDPQAWLDPQLADQDVVVVVGGDGAVRLAAASAARQNVALYHFPSGTENLFAREFGTDKYLSTLMHALDRFETIEVDLATANDIPFVLMVSIGFDAEVVHDLAATRGRRISHLTYVRPMLRQLRRWRPTELTVDLDGTRIIEQQQGILVVGNSRQYAARLNPAYKADMSDGLLDVVFHPVQGVGSLLRVLGAHIMGRQATLDSAVYERGTSVGVHCDRPVRYQLDGDPPQHPADTKSSGLGVSELRIMLKSKKLRVLIPVR